MNYLINPQPYTGWGTKYSKNTGTLSDIHNLSWVFATKYTIDALIQLYVIEMGFPYSSITNFKMNPKYIFNCIATNEEERKKGMAIETIFERLNLSGLGEDYEEATETVCPTPVPILDSKRFITKKLMRQNRSGLMNLMYSGFLPIVPISVDLDELRFIHKMDASTHHPIYASADDPTMFGVLNAYNMDASFTPYWEVVTHVIPAEPLKLVLKMSDDVENQNTHGIAAFAVGVTVNMEFGGRRLRR